MKETPSKEALVDVFLKVVPRVSVEAAVDRASETLAEISRGAPATPSLVCIGKMASAMARTVAQRCGWAEVQGLVASPYEGESQLAGLTFFAGGHPSPNANSLRAGNAALDLASRLGRDDLVVFLLSGGGSAACELPASPSLSLEDIQTTYQTLIQCGASIEEVNCVRKHLSAIKGGKLAALAYPAKQVTLLISDVPEGKEHLVASGPSMPDPSSPEDALHVLDQYEIRSAIPASALAHLSSATATTAPETEPFSRSSWHTLMSNQDALEAASQLCRAKEWRCEIDTTSDEMPIEESLDQLLRRLEALRRSGDTPACVVAGGDVRSIVRGSGKGGRNQAFVLEAIPRIAGQRIAVLSAGTDGIDGNSRAAGAVADGDSAKRLEALGSSLSEIRASSDSNRLFQQLDDEIVTGPSGTNVRDLRILVAW